MCYNQQQDRHYEGWTAVQGVMKDESEFTQITVMSITQSAVSWKSHFVLKQGLTQVYGLQRLPTSEPGLMFNLSFFLTIENIYFFFWQHIKCKSFYKNAVLYKNTILNPDVHKTCIYSLWHIHVLKINWSVQPNKMQYFQNLNSLQLFWPFMDLVNTNEKND